MKQHTVKVEAEKNGKVTQVSLTRNGETAFLQVSKKGNIFDGTTLIGVLKREKGRWFENQYKIVFHSPANNNPPLTVEMTDDGIRFSPIVKL